MVWSFKLGLTDRSLDPDVLETNVLDKNRTTKFKDSVCQVSELLYLMYNNTNYLFSFLGSSLKENIYKRTTKNTILSKDLSIEDFKTANKDKLYDEWDERLKNLIDF